MADITLALSDAQLSEVRRILGEHVSDAKVRVFGSRATSENLKVHSDLDLLVIREMPLPTRQLRRLKEAFEDSALPFRVDIVESASLDTAFEKKILPEAVPIFEEEADPAR